MSRFSVHQRYVGFEAQTGIIRYTAPKAPSNFYLYLIDIKFLAKLKLIAERCPDLTAEDIQWLKDRDIANPLRGEFPDGTWVTKH